MTASKPLPIIHLNGFPGTGKLTVARHLEQLLAPQARLIHNHLLINPADAVLRRDEEGYQNLRHAIRAAIFASLIGSTATHNIAYLFTDFQSSDEIGSAVCAEYLAAAQNRGCELISVVLSCDVDTNVERLTTDERRAHGKIVNAELLKKFRKGVEIHRFEDLGVKRFELVARPFKDNLRRTACVFATPCTIIIWKSHLIDIGRKPVIGRSLQRWLR